MKLDAVHQDSEFAALSDELRAVALSCGLQLCKAVQCCGHIDLIELHSTMRHTGQYLSSKTWNKAANCMWVVAACAGHPSRRVQHSRDVDVHSYNSARLS